MDDNTMNHTVLMDGDNEQPEGWIQTLTCPPDPPTSQR